MPVHEQSSVRSVWHHLDAWDRSLYHLVASSSTSDLDPILARVSSAADRSKVWMGVAALLACTGPNGRRAAVHGLAAGAVTSAVVNLGAKRLTGRPRPDRDGGQVPAARHVQMPASTSFPSGHAATAFAFATTVGTLLPATAAPLTAAATLVAYSRIHTGVHYPIDVAAGALIGYVLAFGCAQVGRRWLPVPRSAGG